MKKESIFIKGINKSFNGEVVLKNIDLEIKGGEFFSILGPSGCGKTTLLRILAGFIEADNGVVYLGNKDISDLPSNLRPINTIFQKYALFPHLSVYENIAFSLKLKNKSKQFIDEEVKKMLKMIDLEGYENKKPNHLSGGQQQRVSIARALINKPKVLLLDEPLSALDAKLRQTLLIELDNIHEEVGITFIFITHDQQEALSISDRIAVMNKGEILQVGSPAEVYESPDDMFVADFIGENNFIEGKVIKINSENHATLYNKKYGEILFEIDKEINLGNKVKLSIRPEKIKVTKSFPKKIDNRFNVLKVYVHEVIYTGFQSKYFVWVNGNENISMRAFKQHAIYFEDDDTSVKWDEEAYISWNSEDSYLVEVVEGEFNEKR
ncbi:MAG: ABC transporter ATP-binding protein [Fusobacterium sp. JB021]|nr:ABC transporter ATP-binding protein [Fusobacterium sp. JB021]MDP0507098.1 ABC transporter ATP-binding protein [Fusobacterium sp. JB019]